MRIRGKYTIMTCFMYLNQERSTNGYERRWLNDKKYTCIGSFDVQVSIGTRSQRMRLHPFDGSSVGSLRVPRRQLVLY